jgi:hypothetical protein
MKVAGAEFITDIYLDYIKTTTDKTVLFPDSFFYPMPNSFRYEIRKDTAEDRIRIHSYIKPKTYCVHLWYTSWLKEEEPAKPIKNISISKKEDSLDKFMKLAKMNSAKIKRLHTSPKPRRLII